MNFLKDSLIELITQTSTNLPPDVRAAMGVALEAETPGTQSAQALGIIATNIDMAQEDEGPICQDTGMPTFVVHTPVGVNQLHIKRAIREAVAEATRRGKLRPNSVDSLTGKNSGDNLGDRDAGDSLRAVGRGRDRSEADPERRRLREQEHPVFAALRAGSHGPRRPQSGRRAQVHSARGVAGAGAGLRAGRGGRVHRQRSRARIRVWRRSSCSARWTM